MSQSRIHDHFGPSNKYPSRKPQSGTQRHQPQGYEHDSDGSEGLEAIHLSPSKPKTQSQAGRKEAASKPPSTLKKGPKRVVVISDDDEEEEEEVEESRAGPSSPRRKAASLPKAPLSQKRAKRTAAESDDEYEEEGQGPSSGRSSRQRRAVSPPPKAAASQKRGGRAAAAESDDDYEEERPEPSSGRAAGKRKESSHPKMPVSQKRTERAPVVESDEEDPEGEEEETEEGRPARSSRRRITEVPPSWMRSSSEEEAEAGPSSRRRKAEAPPARARLSSGGGRKAVVDPDEAGSASEPDSLDGIAIRRSAKGKGRATARDETPPPSFEPGPPSRAKDRGSEAGIFVEVPLLSKKDRALYLPFESPTRSSRTASKKKEVIEVSSSGESEDDDNTPILIRRRVPSRSKAHSSPTVVKRPTRSTASPLAQNRTPSNRSAPPPKSRAPSSRSQTKSKPPPPSKRQRPARSPSLTPLDDRDTRSRSGRNAPPLRKRGRSPSLTPPAESDSRPRSGRKTPGSTKRKREDPDENADEAETEEETDMVAELELDQADRFQTRARLRPKGETQYQRSLRKMKNRRLGIVESSSEDEDGDDEQGDEEAEVEAGLGGRNVDADGDAVTDDLDFISDDGDDGSGVELPHEFSHNSAQTPEFKFKVVFHYLLYLVVKGSDVLPLRGDAADYFEPYLRDVRRRMTSLRDSSVRSQIWKPELVKKLGKYPVFHVEHIDSVPEYWCDACRRRMPSWLFVWVSGAPYNRDTHEEIDDSGVSSGDESDTLPSTRRWKRRRQFMVEAVKAGEDLAGGMDRRPNIQMPMGNHCMNRARVYHKLSHWEDDMYDKIKDIYYDILRAKRMTVADDSDTSLDEDSEEEQSVRKARQRVRREQRERAEVRAKDMRAKRLPEDVHDVDEVLEWMDYERIQSKLFQEMEDLEKEARYLENDKSKDE